MNANEAAALCGTGKLVGVRNLAGWSTGYILAVDSFVNFALIQWTRRGVPSAWVNGANLRALDKPKTEEGARA
jgi:hypothetical protein